MKRYVVLSIKENIKYLDLNTTKYVKLKLHNRWLYLLEKNHYKIVIKCFIYAVKTIFFISHPWWIKILMAILRPIIRDEFQTVGNSPRRYSSPTLNPSYLPTSLLLLIKNEQYHHCSDSLEIFLRNLYFLIFKIAIINF